MHSPSDCERLSSELRSFMELSGLTLLRPHGKQAEQRPGARCRRSLPWNQAILLSAELMPSRELG